MSKNKQRKRLQRNQRLINLPLNLIKKNLLNKSSNYVKYFDYSLPELLADHSTDPMQNTARQYISSDSPNEGRFVNHQMIIRRNGESIILRPKHDIVLVNGFTPISRPSPLLLSYQAVPLQSRIALSSSSIINKMSISKRRTRKRKNRRRKAKSKINEFNLNNQSKSTLEQNHCFQQQSVPIHDSSPNFRNQPLIRQLEDICFNRNTIQSPLSKNNYVEYSYDMLEGEYCDFKENNHFPNENACLNLSNDNLIPDLCFNLIHL